MEFDIDSSITLPTIIVAFSDAYCLIISMISKYSFILKSLLVDIFTSIPFALLRLTSSNKGHATADFAAISALSDPSAKPDPIIAIPISLITVLTSAKSTLIIPGLFIISAMPKTALYKTSLAAPNASTKVTSSPRTPINFSLGIVIKEST